MSEPLVLTTAEIARIVCGRVVAEPVPSGAAGFAIDSRRVTEGVCFIALEGARTDGHAHLAEAAARGARMAIVSKSVEQPGLALVQVVDTHAALCLLGAEFRSRWPLKVIGITGSAGKTTTKEFTADLLATRFEVFRSQGNFNNLIGLPLTLTTRRSAHQLAVLEMGMSTPGELAELSLLVRPDVAAIVNVGYAHSLNFADIDAIAAAKAEILTGLPPSGVLVANADDARVAAIAERFAVEHQGRVVRFGFGEAADVRAGQIEVSGVSTHFTLSVGGRQRPVSIRARGQHQVANALAALAVAESLGLSAFELADALADLAPAAGRGRLIELGQAVVVMDDAYNANPEALAAAARALPNAGRRRVAIVGDMLELGELEVAAHEASGRLLAELGYSVVVGVGSLSARLVQAAAAAGVETTLPLADAASAVAAVADLVQAGDAVLVKGSRGIGLEVVVEAIGDRFGAVVEH